MSTLHQKQINSLLERDFIPHVDDSDLAKEPEQARFIHKLSRSLPAFYLASKLSLSPSETCKYITDGFKDNGVDGVYIDDVESTLYLFQSKWIEKGTGVPDQGEFKKFRDGCKDLLSERWNKFNNKFTLFKAEISNILTNPDLQIKMIFLTTGSTPSKEQTQEIMEFVTDQNRDGEIICFDFLPLHSLHDLLKKYGQPTAVNFELTMKDWGRYGEDDTSYYGTVNALEIAEIHAAHSDKLFVENIRKFKGDTDVNASIQETLVKKPNDFWNFNNGITILCRSITKTAKGGGGKDIGIFSLEGASVVNGAQTLGSIGRLHQSGGAELQSAYLLARIIPVGSKGDSYSKDITKAANTQNRIDRKDFASLDPTQTRLEFECRLHGINYLIKTGDKISDKSKQFEIDEAMVTQACSSKNLSLVTLAKKELGSLFDLQSNSPYHKLFHRSLSGIELWNKTKLQRIIDDHIQSRIDTSDEDTMYLLRHANRFLSYRIWNTIQREKGFSDSISEISFNPETYTGRIKTRLRLQSINLQKSVNKLFPNAYLARLFYNIEKCESLDSAMNNI